jgi:hypothetical protein
VRHPHKNTLAIGVMPMPTSRSSIGRQHGSTEMPRIHAGHIGPIRREIIFEPLPDAVPAQPAPVAPPPVSPETQPKEPIPDPA